MDRLNYTYRDGTNQLWSVQDGIAAGAYAGDIDNQGGSNYSYDRIGNLIGDVSENISQVNWTVYGKIGNIQKKQAFLGYVYNAGGERVVKQYLPYATNQCLGCDENTGMVDLEVYERNSNTPNIYKASKTITFLSEYTDVRYRDYSAIIEAGLAQCTPQCAARPALNTSDADIYIRDATGNVLAVYHYDRKTSQLRWSEQHLYGSSRLGMYLPEKLLTSVSTDSKQREVGYLGKQVFELSNHLGNILATITDKKQQVSLNTTSTAYFEADVQTVQDYYAFGMQMPGRKLSGGYRYGFNGKENDNEIKGEGNQQDYGMRIYDGRIGKFLSVDPLTKGFPQLTPYQFASNSPIANIDLDGGEAKYYDIVLREFYDGKGMLKKTTKSTEYDKTKEAGWHLNGIIPWYTKSGRLGEGNMYSVTKVKQYAADDKGVERIEIATIGSIYTPPPPEPNKEHPEASGSFGIQVFGSGYDPNQAPTSRANAKMHVITMNFKEFQEIMEPILVGVDAKFPSELKLPSLDDLIEHVGEYAIDKAIENLNKKWELMQKKSNEDTYCRSCAKTFKKKDGEVTWDETKAPAKDTIEVHGSNSKSNN